MGETDRARLSGPYSQEGNHGRPIDLFYRGGCIFAIVKGSFGKFHLILPIFCHGFTLNSILF